MARARNIKPGLFKNEILGVADPLYTLLFEGLWLLSDREGRLEDRPLRIKAEVFPYREGIDLGAMLDWLERAGFVRRYQRDGLALIQILNFTKHQNPHKNEPDSHYPEPEEIGSTPDFFGSAPADSGFRIPDSGLLTADTPNAGREVPSPTKAGAICRAIKAKGVHGLNTSNPELLALIEKGVPVETFEAAAEVCAKSNPPKGLGYLLAIVKRQLAEAAAISGGPAAAVQAADPDSRSAIEAEGVAMGIGKWNEIAEQWHVYKARVRGRQPNGLGLDQLAAMAAQRGVH